MSYKNNNWPPIDGPNETGMVKCNRSVLLLQKILKIGMN